jgi:hypothetical protein
MRAAAAVSPGSNSGPKGLVSNNKAGINSISAKSATLIAKHNKTPKLDIIAIFDSK